MSKIPPNKSFMRDPATVNCRIYIGGLDETFTEEILQEHFKKFGNIMGIVVQRNFGFIQFEEEGSAQEAINNENGVMLNGRRLNVKQALDNKNKQQNQPAAKDEGNTSNMGPNRPAQGQQDNHQGPGQPPRKMARRGGRGGGRGGHAGMERDLPPHVDEYDSQYRDGPPYYGGMEKPYPPGGYGMMPPERPMIPERNDCEIIVVSKALTEYAEYIEQRLKTVGLTVDLLFPNEDVPIGRVLANISSRGCLYAILVMPQNEEHRSLTLNILHGLPQEHRNMPLEDAIALITRNFDAYLRGEKSSLPNITAPPLSERHPEPIQILLNLLADNRQLTTLQYDRIIKYLQEKRELQYKQELGDTLDSSLEPDENKKAAELQNRIMSILNKTNTDSSANSSSFTNSLFSNPVSNSSFQSKSSTNVSKPAAPTLLHDPSVQKALDSLMQGDLLKNITGSNKL